MSDMGRVLCSIVEDHLRLARYLVRSLGPGAGCHEVRTKAVPRGLPRNDFYRNARDNFLVELAKYGLGKQELVPNVNFFSKVSADADGGLTFAPGNASGRNVRRAPRGNMNVLAILAAVPHPLDPAATLCPSRSDSPSLFRGDAPGPDDLCRCSRPETRRAFENTEALFR